MLNKGDLINIIAKKDKYIADNIKKIGREASRLQDELFTMIIENYATKFSTAKGGGLKPSLLNIRFANSLDNIYDKFNRLYNDRFIKNYANSLLRITNFTEKYFSKFEVPQKKINSLIRSLDFTYESIGITKNGKLIKDGYLARLGRNEEVRMKLRKYTLNSVNAGKSMEDFTSGFKNIIKGTEDIDGRLSAYYRQYTYDTYNQLSEAQNLHMAEGMGLQAFIYSGTIIKTSRPFCEKRSGRVYTRDEAKRWNKIKPWAGAIKPLNFFINRGGYNCRHDIAWISNELAIKLRPELKGKLK